jgi:hypothetical protein
VLPFNSDLLSSRLVSKNTTIKIQKTVIVPLVFNRHEILSLNLREECGLRVLENIVLRDEIRKLVKTA